MDFKVKTVLLKHISKSVALSIRYFGWGETLQRVFNKIGIIRLRADYHSFVQKKEAEYASRPYIGVPGPKITIVVPTFNTSPDAFNSMLQSVRRQTYPYWELILVDNGSSSEFQARLRYTAETDERIRLIVWNKT